MIIKYIENDSFFTFTYVPRVYTGHHKLLFLDLYKLFYEQLLEMVAFQHFYIEFKVSYNEGKTFQHNIYSTVYESFDEFLDRY